MDKSRTPKILRWIARIWTVPILLIAIAEIAFPHSDPAVSIPLNEWIELGFLGVGILGLVLAWRFEALGGSLAIAGAVGNSAAFLLFRGMWMPALGILALMLIIPGSLFLGSWSLSKGRT